MCRRPRALRACAPHELGHGKECFRRWCLCAGPRRDPAVRAGAEHLGFACTTIIWTVPAPGPPRPEPVHCQKALCDVSAAYSSFLSFDPSEGTLAANVLVGSTFSLHISHPFSLLKSRLGQLSIATDTCSRRVIAIYTSKVAASPLLTLFCRSYCSRHT